MIEPVQSKHDIEIVIKLANTIWHEHYAPIIGSDQVSYMLENFHSFEVIKEQIKTQGHLYFLIQQYGRSIGYMGVQPVYEDRDKHKDKSKNKGGEADHFNKRRGILILSKLYILSSERSRGIGRMAIAYLVELAAELNLSTIRLMVHKNNAHSIIAYKKMGFVNIDTALSDIGGGYVMDDYVMELTI